MLWLLSKPSLVNVSCSDDIDISPEIRAPDQFIDEFAHTPRASPARPARIEAPTFRYSQKSLLRARNMTLADPAACRMLFGFSWAGSSLCTVMHLA